MEDLAGIVLDDDQCALLNIVMSARIHELERTIKLIEDNEEYGRGSPAPPLYKERLVEQKGALTVVKSALHKYRIDTYHGGEGND